MFDYVSGLCFVTFFIFPCIGNHHPNWLIFFRGVGSTNNQRKKMFDYPRWSMYGIFTYIYPIYDPNVGKYTIHGSSGYVSWVSVVATDYYRRDSKSEKHWRRLRDGQANSHPSVTERAHAVVEICGRAAVKHGTIGGWDIVGGYWMILGNSPTMVWLSGWLLQIEKVEHN